MSSYPCACGQIHTTFWLEPLIKVMRQRGDDHLIHYAGAAHRDNFDWHVAHAYLENPEAGEAVYRSLAHKRAHNVDVSVADVEAVMRLGRR